MRIPGPQGFTAETEREFDEICEALEQLFSERASEPEDFQIYEHSATGCSIDFSILNYNAIKPTDIEERLVAIQEILRRYQQFWCVRIWLYGPNDTMLQPDRCIWLEITKYAVGPFRGKTEIELFKTMGELYMHYWGKDFSSD